MHRAFDSAELSAGNWRRLARQRSAKQCRYSSADSLEGRGATELFHVPALMQGEYHARRGAVFASWIAGNSGVFLQISIFLPDFSLRRKTTACSGFVAIWQRFFRRKVPQIALARGLILCQGLMFNCTCTVWSRRLRCASRLNGLCNLQSLTPNPSSVHVP